MGRAAGGGVWLLWVWLLWGLLWSCSGGGGGTDGAGGGGGGGSGGGDVPSLSGLDDIVFELADAGGAALGDSLEVTGDLGGGTARLGLSPTVRGDVLSISILTADAVVAVSGTVTVGGVRVATFSGGTSGEDLVISWAATVTGDQVEAVLKAARFVADDSDPRARTLSITLTDASEQGASGAVQIGVLPNVLGQPDTSRNLGRELGFFHPIDLCVADGKLLVADQNNNRVLIWNEVPDSAGVTPDLVLGQANLQLGAESPNTTARTFSEPNRVWSDGTRVLVSDTDNHRVLLWNTFPTTNRQAADVVIGKDSFTDGDFPGGVTASALSSPDDALITGDGKLVISDTGHLRVLIWNTVPTSNGAAADLVLGQPDMITSAASFTPTATSISGAYGLAVAGSKLFVADAWNARILIWNTFPTANQQAADVVVGQTSLTSSAGTGGTADSFRAPWDISVVSGKLAVADAYSTQVMLWNAVPTSDGVSADVVIGADAFDDAPSSETYVMTASGMRNPTAVQMVGGRIWVADPLACRVQRWDTLTPVSGQDCDFVLGQPSSTGMFPDAPPAPETDGSKTLHRVAGLGSDGESLFVTDAGHHRVLAWNAAPIEPSADVDFVLGQTDADSSDALTQAAVARSLLVPFDVATDGTRVAVADTGNHRVSLWNTMPSSSAVAPDVILGHSLRVTNTSNSGGSATGSSMSFPFGVSIGGDVLAVADRDNRRVLLWTAWPEADGEAADVVVGQVDATSTSYGATASSMGSPGSVWTDGQMLVVSDYSNDRVLIWNSIPTVNGASADVVVGQADMTGSFSNRGGDPDAGTLDSPAGVLVADGKLVVADDGNNRVLIWDAVPTTNGVAADRVVGQADFTTVTPNTGGLSEASLNGPWDIAVVGDRLFIADQDNNRVLVTTWD